MGPSLLVACGGSAGATRPPATPSPTAIRSTFSWLNIPPGKSAGEQVAQDLVDAAVLPPGSQRLTKSPSPVLDKPSGTIANDNFLDRNTWWKANLSTKDLLSYLRAHPLKGLVLRVTGSGVDGFNKPMQYELEFDGAHPLPATPAVQYTITSAGAGASWVRVDGWTIWYPARPAAETAPSAGVVTIGISSGPTRTVTDPAVVRRLATEFNSLLRTTPGHYAGPNCGPNDRTLTISFTKPGGAAPTITASESGCFPAWAVRGPGGDLPALDDTGSAMLRTDALHLLGDPAGGLAGPPPTAGG